MHALEGEHANCRSGRELEGRGRGRERGEGDQEGPSEHRVWGLDISHTLVSFRVLELSRTPAL
jgi:hypothetical protein